MSLVRIESAPAFCGACGRYSFVCGVYVEGDGKLAQYAWNRRRQACSEECALALDAAQRLNSPAPPMDEYARDTQLTIDVNAKLFKARPLPDWNAFAEMLKIGPGRVR